MDGHCLVEEMFVNAWQMYQVLETQCGILVHWSFSVIGVRFCRFYRITRELKNPGAKCYPHWEVNPGTDFPMTFMSCMLPLSFFFFLNFLSEPRSILWSHWLLLFWTLCVLPHGFQIQSGYLACTLSCLQLWSWRPLSYLCEVRRYQLVTVYSVS